MNSAYDVPTISKGAVEFASPGIDAQDLSQRGPSISPRSPGPNGVWLGDPYHGDATDPASACNTMPLRRSRGERAQVFLCGQG